MFLENLLIGALRRAQTSADEASHDLAQGRGVIFGLVVCFLLTAFRVVRFPPEIAKVYYLTWMPFRPEPLHVLGILGIGLLLVLGASLLPARRAARMNPSEALRYE